ILAALAAVTALSVATGKAADALDVAIKNGARLYTTIASVPNYAHAQAQIRVKQEHLQQQLDAQLLTVKAAQNVQSINAGVITSLQAYLFSKNPNTWTRATADLYKASAALSQVALMFRQNAIWF